MLPGKFSEGIMTMRMRQFVFSGIGTGRIRKFAALIAAPFLAACLLYGGAAAQSPGNAQGAPQTKPQAPAKAGQAAARSQERKEAARELMRRILALHDDGRTRRRSAKPSGFRRGASENLRPSTASASPGLKAGFVAP